MLLQSGCRRVEFQLMGRAKPDPSLAASTPGLFFWYPQYVWPLGLDLWGYVALFSMLAPALL